MSLGTPASEIDRRQFGRRLTNFDAWIRPPGKPSIHCTVRDISESGAMLACDLPRTLPYRFELVIPLIPARLMCEVRRVSDKTVGVLFPLDSAPEAKPEQVEHYHVDPSVPDARELASMTGKELVTYMRTRDPAVHNRLAS